MSKPPSSVWSKIRFWLVVAATAVVAVIFLQNSQSVELSVLWFAPMAMPASIWLLLTLLFGVVLGMFLSMLLRHRK